MAVFQWTSKLLLVMHSTLVVFRLGWLLGRGIPHQHSTKPCTAALSCRSPFGTWTNKAMGELKTCKKLGLSKNVFIGDQYFGPLQSS